MHRGPALVGNVGCSLRVNYTALGEAVNIASRLEGLNKAFHTSIIASETVLQDALDTAPVFCGRRLGVVKSRGHPLGVYHLIGVIAEGADNKQLNHRMSVSTSASGSTSCSHRMSMSTNTNTNTNTTNAARRRQSVATTITTTSNVREMSTNEELSAIRVHHRVAEALVAAVTQLNTAVEAFEKGSFDVAERVTTEVISSSGGLLEQYGIEAKTLRAAVEQYQMLQVHPPCRF